MSRRQPGPPYLIVPFCFVLVAFILIPTINSVADLKIQSVQQLYNQHEYLKAKDAIDKTLQFSKENYPADHPAIIEAESLAGKIYMALGDYQRAEAFMLSAEASLKKVSGNNPQATVPIRNDLARLYLNLEKFDQAEKILLELKETYSEKYADGYGAFGAESASVDPRLPAELSESERDKILAYPEPSDQFSRMVKHFVELKEYGRVMNRLQQLYRLRGKYSEAANACEKTVEIFAKVYGDNDSFVETITKECAEIYRLNKDYLASAKTYERALKITQSNYGPSSFKNLPIVEGLIAVYTQIGNNEKSAEYQQLKEEIKK